MQGWFLIAMLTATQPSVAHGPFDTREACEAQAKLHPGAFCVPWLPTEQAESRQLYDTESGAQMGPFRGQQPPFWRRAFIACLGILGGFFVYIYGLSQFNHKRRAFGAALVGLSMVAVFGGFGLLWLTSFPVTWGGL